MRLATDLNYQTMNFLRRTCHDYLTPGLKRGFNATRDGH